MRPENKMHDVQNDFWTRRLGVVVSVAEVATLTRIFNRAHGVRKWEKANRIVRGKKAFRQPGTPEAGQHNMMSMEREEFIRSRLKARIKSAKDKIGT